MAVIRIEMTPFGVHHCADSTRKTRAPAAAVKHASPTEQSYGAGPLSKALGFEHQKT